MKKYNYMHEIITQKSVIQQKNYETNCKPKENILNDQDQNLPNNSIDETFKKNELKDKIKAFEEGIRNDSNSVEENMDGIDD